MKIAAVAYDRQNVQRDLMNIVDDLITATADVYEKSIKEAKTQEKIEFLENQRLEIASGALDNAVDANPLAGLMDTVVLVSLSRSSMELPATRTMLGESFDAIIAMLKSQEETAWLVAARYLSAEQIAELRRAIDDWREKNPDQRFVSHVRLVDFLNALPTNNASVQKPGSIFSLLFIDPLAGLDPAVREIALSRDIAERMFFYSQRISLILSWRVEVTSRHAVTQPEVTAWRDEIVRFNKTAEAFNEQMSRFVAAIEKWPDVSGQLVNQFFKSFDVSADKVVKEAATQVSAVREAAVTHAMREIAVERDRAIVEATTRFAAERESAFKQLSNDFRLRQQETTKDVELAADRTSTHFTGGLLYTIVISILVFFGALIVYQLLMRVIRRKQ